MFERIDIAESINEGVVEHFYKNLIVHTTTVLVTSGKDMRSRLFTDSLRDVWNQWQEQKIYM